MKQYINAIIAAAVLLLVLSSGAMAASDKEKKVSGDVTKLLLPGAVPGYCPTTKDDLTGSRPVIFINSLDVSAEAVSVNLWALGGQGTVGSMDEIFPHGFRLTAYVGDEVVGVSEETRPWFSAGQFQTLVIFTRELTSEEQQQAKVVLKVDYYPESQRTVSGNTLFPIYYKESEGYYDSLDKIQEPVTIYLDKRYAPKDYFYPSVLCYEVRDGQGELVAEQQYITVWFDKYEYTLPAIELFEGVDLEEGESLYLTLRAVS